MKKIIIAILRFLWPPLAAALEAYWNKEQEEQAAVQQEVHNEQEQIVTEEEHEADQIPSLSDAELTAAGIDVGLVRPADNPSGVAKDPGRAGKYPKYRS